MHAELGYTRKQTPRFPSQEGKRRVGGEYVPDECMRVVVDER
jgi:hypothetical protein